MLEQELFDTSEPLLGFNLPAKKLFLGEIEIGPVDIPARYDANWKLIFQLGVSSSTADVISGNVTASFQANGATSRTELLITKTKHQLGSEHTTFEAVLATEPAMVPSSSKGQGFKAILLTPPNFLGRTIRLTDASGTTFELEPVKAKDNPCCIIKSDIELSMSKPLEKISDLRIFLTFLKGGNCGLGHFHALNMDAAYSFWLLGFGPNDPAKRQTNWFDIEVLNDLPHIFSCFSAAIADKKTRVALTQTINFYRASNASRAVSLEMSIIAAHSALEAVVNYILENRAGWSKTLMSERSISMSDKMRAAAASFGLDGSALTRSPELLKLSAERNKMDVFSLISFMRNKLVHQDTKFRPTGVQLHETWLVAQWLVEILIFGIIGYRGKIIDRRIYGGWRGQTCEIPLQY